MRTFCLSLILCLIAGPATPLPTNAQAAPDSASEEETPTMTSPVAPTPADVRLDGYRQRQRLAETSLVDSVPFRNVGPTVMSGRVVDLAVDPEDPTTFYVAYASGGLWKTTNNGNSFTPVFDEQAAMTLGDIAVDWRRGGTIWAGTGENNSSRSSYAGTGVYKSTDDGKTWQHAGLAATQRTGRILLHPADSNTVWVAALGPLYTPSRDRGVYKTTDGGETWQQTLFVDENTGAIDLVRDPNDPDVLYAATWHRERRAWNFVEGGEGSGIYKSTDGGTTWTRLNTEESGFPTGPHVGRIGLDLSRDGQVLYALLDNQERRPEEDEEDAPALTKDMLREMSREAFLEVGEQALEDYLERNGFPAAYTATSILEMVRNGELEPLALVTYLEDANQQLFDTPVIGGEVYRSDDGGQTWRKTNEDYIDDFYYSYGYYFGEIRVSPHDPQQIYLLGVPLLTSKDGGRTFEALDKANVHVDHHALWVNPERPGHLVDGNDGGVNITYDDGATWIKANLPPVGQFYTVQVDEAEPYNVYGGLQDNGVWTGPVTYEHSYEWYAEGDYPYDRLLGGDGMQVEVDPRDGTVYTGFQFGNYFRIDPDGGAGTPIKPRHELGEPPLRYNWLTPIHLSRHNPDILYFGSNKFHRSLNRGKDWEALSGDLTRGGRKGDVPYGTLTTIDESPLRFGLLYAGSDDGLVHVSRDAGTTWTRVSDSLPADLWVSRVEASNHAEGRVYVSLNGYRWDHFAPYVYRSDDHGQTWTRLGEDLPPEPVNVVLEDPANEDVLYVGTDHGVYVSLDRGQSFMAMKGGLPDAPVHDLKIQAREKDLVAGTHGRSIYVAPVAHLQQLTPDLIAQPLHVFAVDSVAYDESWGERRRVWTEANEPEVQLAYFAGADGEATIRVETRDDLMLFEHTGAAERGLNYTTYDLRVSPEAAERFNAQQEEQAGEEAEPKKLETADNDVFYLLPGAYTITLSLNGETVTTPLVVQAPPEQPEPPAVMSPKGEAEVK